MLSAGEASGDLYGAEVCRALLEARPGVELFGMGGPRMEAAGMRVTHNPLDSSVIGIGEALAAYRHFRKLLADRVAEVEAERPDVVVTIDFPGFHMRFAREVKRLGVPVAHYIGPAVWAWGRWRGRKVAARTDAVCSIFPFEADILRRYGAKAYFVGHPSVDLVRAETSREAFRREAGFDPDRSLVALLPGSRPQELKALLPVMLEAALLMQREQARRNEEELQFVISPAGHVDGAMVEAMAPKELKTVRVILGQTYECVAAADAAMVASGTATLETALLGTPQVGVYRVSPLTWQIGRRLIRVPSVMLPNIIAGRRVIPELLQDELTPERLAAECRRCLNPETAERMRRDYEEIGRRLGEPGVARRVADCIIAVAEGKDPDL